MTLVTNGKERFRLILWLEAEFGAWFTSFNFVHRAPRHIIGIPFPCHSIIPCYTYDIQVTDIICHSAFLLVLQPAHTCPMTSLHKVTHASQ